MSYKHCVCVSQTFLIIFLVIHLFLLKAGAQNYNQSELVGVDGNYTVTAANTVLNQYTTLAANVSIGATSFNVTSSASLNSALFGNLAAGDLLLIIQMQGATINTVDTVNYGTVTALNSAGLYEFVTVSSISSNTININTTGCGGLRNSYTTAGKTQIVRVPQLNSLTVNSGASVIPTTWNGASGGIVALQVRGNAVINGTISVDATGFRGGVIENDTSAQVANVPGYRSTASSFGAEKGEGIAGFQTDYDSAGRYGRGAAANGGGGGNAHNAGGGGGANGNNGNTWTGQGVMTNTVLGSAAWALDPGYTANGNTRTNSSGGGRGGYSFSFSNQNALTLGPNQAAWSGDSRQERGGLGGRPVANNPATRLFMGGGGGAGDGNNNSNADGGDGGGIVILFADSVSGTGSINANGQTAPNTVNTHNDAPGGGGAGGTVVVGARALTGITINANGGNGGNQLITNDEGEGPGGGGGGGYISTSGGTVTRNVNGGSSGTTTSASLTEFPVNGATFGAVGETGTTSSVPICLVSDLAITITDGVTSIQAGQPVTYTITITNNGPNNVTNAAVNNTLPASLSGATWSCAPSASCGTTSGTGSISNHLITLDSGTSVIFTLTATLSSGASGTLSNTATVTAPFIATESNTANNSATDNDTITAVPTASSVTVGGRVFGTNGRSVFGATVIMVDSKGEIRYSRTNPLGFYRFAEVPGGQTVILNVKHKSYTFSPRILDVIEDLVDENFIAQP
jgi:large repetitive protein